MQVTPLVRLLAKMMASVKIHSLFYFRLQSGTGSGKEYLSSAFSL